MSRKTITLWCPTRKSPPMVTNCRWTLDRHQRYYMLYFLQLLYCHFLRRICVHYYSFVIFTIHLAKRLISECSIHINIHPDDCLSCTDSAESQAHDTLYACYDGLTTVRVNWIKRSSRPEHRCTWQYPSLSVAGRGIPRMSNEGPIFPGSLEGEALITGIALLHSVCLVMVLVLVV